MTYIIFRYTAFHLAYGINSLLYATGSRGNSFLFTRTRQQRKSDFDFTLCRPRDLPAKHKRANLDVDRETRPRKSNKRVILFFKPNLCRLAVSGVDDGQIRQFEHLFFDGPDQCGHAAARKVCTTYGFAE